jgi:hypothetical protein
MGCVVHIVPDGIYPTVGTTNIEDGESNNTLGSQLITSPLLYNLLLNVHSQTYI